MDQQTLYIEDIPVPQFGDARPDELLATLQEENTLLRLHVRKLELYAREAKKRMDALKEQLDPKPDNVSSISEKQV